jgi:hypothetical protein
MSYTLTMSGVIVGRSELELRDASRRVASGAFRPGLGYDLAQPVFALHDSASGDPSALDRYRKAREALRLTLTDASGTSVSLRQLHIRRAADAEPSDSGLVLEVVTDDPRIWADGS